MKNRNTKRLTLDCHSSKEILILQKQEQLQIKKYSLKESPQQELIQISTEIKSVEELSLVKCTKIISQDSFQQLEDFEQQQDPEELKLDFPIYTRKHAKSKFYLSPLIQTSSSPYSSYQSISISQYLCELSKDNNIYTQTYEELGKLGSGCHSICFKVRHKITGELSCAKIQKAEDIEVQNAIQNEFQILKSMEHPNIIRAKEFIEIESLGLFIIILDLHEELTLKQILARFHTFEEVNFDENAIISLAYQLLESLMYLKQKNIIHRDIKPSNLLWSTEQQKLTLIDFGICKKLINSKVALTPTGTSHYKSPEILSDSIYTEQIDIWGVGQVLYEMTTKKAITSKQLIKQILASNCLQFPFIICEALMALILNMLKIDPEERILCENALQNPLFEAFRNNYSPKSTKNVDQN